MTQPAKKGGGKFRKNNAGVKLVHHVIEHLKPLLIEIGSWDEVKQVTPTEIRPIRGNGTQLQIRIQRVEISGFRCVAKRGAVQQTFFITTGEPDAVLKKLQALEQFKS